MLWLVRDAVVEDRLHHQRRSVSDVLLGVLVVAVLNLRGVPVADDMSRGCLEEGEVCRYIPYGKLGFGQANLSYLVGRPRFPFEDKARTWRVRA